MAAKTNKLNRNDHRDNETAPHTADARPAANPAIDPDSRQSDQPMQDTSGHQVEVEMSAEDQQREVARRQRQARLNEELASLRCRHCATVGCWETVAVRAVEGSELKKTFVRCKACGRSAMTAV